MSDDPFFAAVDAATAPEVAQILADAAVLLEEVRRLGQRAAAVLVAGDRAWEEYAAALSLEPAAWRDLFGIFARATGVLELHTALESISRAVDLDELANDVGG